MNRICRMIFFFFCLYTLGYSQKPQRYLNIGTGWGHADIQDPFVSPLRYSGGLSVTYLGFLKQKEQAISNFGLLIRTGNTQPDLDFASQFILRPDLNYRYLRQVFSADSAFGVYLGAGLLTKIAAQLHNRHVNNAFNYDYANSVSLEGNTRQLLTVFKRIIGFSFAFSLPVISYVIHPSFASSLPEGYFEHPDNYFRAFFASGRVLTFNRYLRVNTNVFLDYFLKNGNIFRLTYDWDLYRIRRMKNNASRLNPTALSNRVISANHGLFLSLLFNF